MTEHLLILKILKAIPPIEVLKLIEKLKSNSNTDVVIISGRSHLFMDKYFLH